MKPLNRSIQISIVALISVISFSALADLPDFNFPGDLIYGKDNRVEIDLYQEPEFVEMSHSVAVRVSNKRLTEDRNNSERILFPFITLKSSMPSLCEDERFRDQVSLGSCSGFLVGPKTLVTAGHCIKNMLDCDSNKWVFGFTKETTELEKKQVYSCKKIIAQKNVYDEKEVSDYAVIELDREVDGYVPLKLRKFGRVLINTPLVVIGHPLGLPMKATDGAKVNRMNDEERKNTLKSFLLRSHYFNANLDAYGGNSGSPVFNKRNGQVEGILIQGETDFVFNQEKECHESRKLSDSHHNAFEKVMRINKVPGI
jgi:V8-like Glu-specific endopeptidase